MYNCLVIIPHYTKINNLCYLRTCINGINNHIHPETNITICIVEQSCEEIYKNICSEFNDIKNIKILRGIPIDAGYPIDMALNYYRSKNIDYVCTLDADAFVISNLYFYLPIKLIEKFRFSYVGSSTDFAHWGYLENIKKLYPDQNEWLHINNYYRVSTFSTALKCSDDVGFIRLQNRNKINKLYIKTPIDKLDWADCGVMAQWYSDHIKQGDKLSLEIITRSGLGKQGIYGMNIENMVYHMVFGYRDVEFSNINDYENHTSEKYLHFVNILRNKTLLTKKDILNLIAISEPEKNGRYINWQTKPKKEVNDFIDSYLMNHQ